MGMSRNEAWCLNEKEMAILLKMERSKIRAMCGVQLKDRKRAMDFMLMLGLNEAITDQLTMANSVHWHFFRGNKKVILFNAMLLAPRNPLFWDLWRLSVFLPSSSSYN